MSVMEAGSRAPELSGPDADGKPVSLKDYEGRKLIIFFYPKDDTPGCTAEACNLRDGISELKDAGFDVLGVSPDTIGKHRKFIDKYDLPYRLLADPEKVNAKAYGVWGRKKFMGREYEGIIRTTFLIDRRGYIEKVIPKVRTKDHAQQILELVTEEQRTQTTQS